jgi:phosphoglucosamine mutase
MRTRTGSATVKKRNYFGTDGVRGRVGEEPITPEMMLKLGWAAGCVLGARGENPGKILIGKDTRVSGYLLESALECGLSSAGVDIRLLGPMPTPAIAYLTRTARARAGIVISASHNPYEDNGIKFFSSEGAKLPDDVELAIEEVMGEPLRMVASGAIGKAKRYEDAGGRYIEFCKSTFPHRANLVGLRIVVDCANGAAYHVAPLVFSELGAEVIAIANEPDGFNINRECGSTHPQTLRRAVLDARADLGIALDGDGDRVIMVDADGTILDGDHMLYIIARDRLTSGWLRGGIVGTLMSNFGLELVCRQQNIPFVRAAVGDRYVMSSLIEQKWELGGETSGHIICLDKHTTGDGIIAALQVLSAMVRSGRALTELRTGLEIFPQHMINVRMSRRFDVQTSPAVQGAVRDAERELNGKGRVVLRASGTEPVIRVMVEGSDKGQVERLSQQLADAVRQAADVTA